MIRLRTNAPTAVPPTGSGTSRGPGPGFCSVLDPGHPGPSFELRAYRWTVAHPHLRQKAHDRGLRMDGVRRRISVDLPRIPGRLSLLRRHPFVNRVVRLVYAVVRPAVNSYGGLAPWRFGRIIIAEGLKRACDLDAEVAENRRARLIR